MPSPSRARPTGDPSSGPPAAARGGVVWDVLRRALRERSRRAGRDGLDVLDLGGGSGSFAVPVAGLGHRVTVVDPSPDALFALERRAAEEDVADAVRGVQGDTQDVAEVTGRGAFDLVLCHGVLEHVEDPGAGLRAVASTLRPAGGTLSVLAAGAGGAVLARALAGRFTEARTALADPSGRWGAGDPVPHRFTVERLTALLSAAGLVPGQVHGVRVFEDLLPGTPWDAEPDAAAALARLESEAAGHPAFQAVAGQLHVLAELPGEP
ncbi:Methyltransferase domain-containing protein [Streptomyces zhaozhouensis]|uniref:Methyltransferase domain-containing protein n=1 Tax=Streptomyces zhaozhouensis TaxID=1300267 RepID=A0A286DJB8_9ACTN|nr:methyltransferase [Streptomyces zhaozhouensis]SOD58709.1 Methyltransferase domain-containing protein [Streptomyces zhaozhouensis]